MKNQPYEYQHIILVTEHSLAAALFCAGHRAKITITEPPRYKAWFAFEDTRKLRRAIKQYLEGKLLVDAQEFNNELFFIEDLGATEYFYRDHCQKDHEILCGERNDKQEA